MKCGNISCLCWLCSLEEKYCALPLVTKSMSVSGLTVRPRPGVESCHLIEVRSARDSLLWDMGSVSFHPENVLSLMSSLLPCWWRQLTKISRMSMLVKRGSSGSGSAGDEKDKDRDDGAGVRSMMMAPPPLRGFKKNEKAKVGGGGSGAAELLC